MAYATTAIVLVAGLAVFCAKYVAVFSESTNRFALLLRLLLVVDAVVVLVGPLDWCSDWAFEIEEAIPAAFIVALSEVYGITCSCKCGIVTAATACVYALVNATHETSCSGGFFGASLGGIALSAYAWYES